MYVHRYVWYCVCFVCLRFGSLAQNNAVDAVHATAAVVLFLFGILYIYMQTALSYFLASARATEYIGPWTLRLRLCCCLLIMVSVIVGNARK